jgi:hypothetical protein
LSASVGRVADFLISLGLFKRATTNPLGVHLVGNSIFGVTCVIYVNSLQAMKSVIATVVRDIPLGVATAGICVLEPPCAAYLSPTFFTPWVSNMFLQLALDVTTC